MMKAAGEPAPLLTPAARAFLDSAGWGDAACAPLAGDASARRYFRLRKEGRSAVLMDASQTLECVPPFVRLAEHLRQLGLSAPALYARAEAQGLVLEEDFGDGVFARLLDDGSGAEELYAVATDVLVALHRHPQAIPAGLRAYDPPRMLDDLEVFLEWCAPRIGEEARAEFRAAWREVLPQAHQVPASLLLRDYHVANLMWLPDRAGVRRAGLLDFQDAYQGPVAYDLMSLLEDARRDVPPALREAMLGRYRACFPELDPEALATALAVLAALRHTRVLAIFERLSRRDGKHAYKQLHSPRVARLLRRALGHPALHRVRRWFERHAW